MLAYPISKEHQKLIDEAKKWIGTKETRPNGGSAVESFQKAVDGKAMGEPWCAAFCFFCIKQVEAETGHKSPLFFTEHVMTCWSKSPKNLRLVKPEPGALVLWRFDNSASGHMGIVYDIQGESIKTIEGNTSDGSGVVREGDGVYERFRSIHGSGKMKIVGYLDPFPMMADTDDHQG